jgi:hypothetical protein
MKKIIKITTDVGDAGGMMYCLWQKRLFGWKLLFRSTDSEWIRKLKNHLLLQDKTYTMDNNKEEDNG